MIILEFKNPGLDIIDTFFKYGLNNESTIVKSEFIKDSSDKLNS